MELVLAALICLFVCREVAHYQHVADLRAMIGRQDAASDLFNKASIAIRAIELGKEYEPVAHSVLRTIQKPNPMLTGDPGLESPTAVVPAESAEFSMMEPS